MGIKHGGGGGDRERERKEEADCLTDSSFMRAQDVLFMVFIIPVIITGT